MKARYRGLELQSGSSVFPVLEIVFDWMEEQNGPLPDHTELLHRLRQAGFCFCETVYGCVACKGEHNMPRNEFEQNVPIEEDDKEVPLTLEVGGPIIGTAKVTEDGVAIASITDLAVRRALAPSAESLSLRDPADRYRVEGDIDYGVFEQ